MNTLNQTRFIVARAACLLVEAYKATISEYQQVMPLDLSAGKDAPNDYPALLADAKRGRLRVSTEHNKTSIYGGAGNISFRVFHDYGHLIYDAQFTLNDEILLASTQWHDLKRYIPSEWLAVVHEVYCADTIEQSKHEAATGEFPADQKAFVIAHMAKWFAKRGEV